MLFRRRMMFTGFLVVSMTLLSLAVMQATPTNADAAVSPFGHGRTPAQQAGMPRGEYIVSIAGCAGCHSAYNLTSDRGFPLAGGVEFNLGPAVGKFYAANLTKLQDYTLEDFSKAVRQGISKSGRTMVSVMPYSFYHGMSDDDVQAVYDWLRSLPPVDNQIPAAAPGQAMAAMQPLPAPTGPWPAPAATEAYGKYLVESVMHCGSCHSPRGNDQQIIEGKELAGGTMPLGPADNPIFAPPILGTVLTAKGYSEATFRNAIRQGERPWGATISPQMPWGAYSVLTDDDVSAIWKFLLTTKLDAPWGAPAN